MVKHTQTIPRLLPTNCLSFWPFCGIGTLSVKIKHSEKQRRIRNPVKHLKLLDICLPSEYTSEKEPV